MRNHWHFGPAVELADECVGGCLPEVLFDLAALRRVRADFSFGVSVVAKAAQTFDENILICRPRDDIA